MRLTWAASALLVGAAAMTGRAEATTYHTISQGPDLEVVADETFVTSTVTRTAFCTWDSDWFYVGYQGEQVINPPPTRRLVWYFDTDPRPVPLSGAGTATAIPFGTQAWSLPFFADYAVVASANSGGGLLRWDGAAWVPTAAPIWTIQVGSVDPYMKMGIPRSALGSPASIYALAFLVSFEPGSETTYGSWPNDSLVGGDGYKPAGQFAHWWGYSLGPGVSPNDLAHHSLTLPVELIGFAVE